MSRKSATVCHGNAEIPVDAISRARSLASTIVGHVVKFVEAGGKSRKRQDSIIGWLYSGIVGSGWRSATATRRWESSERLTSSQAHKLRGPQTDRFTAKRMMHAADHVLKAEGTGCRYHKCDST